MNFTITTANPCAICGDRKLQISVGRCTGDTVAVCDCYDGAPDAEPQAVGRSVSYIEAIKDWESQNSDLEAA